MSPRGRRRSITENDGTAPQQNPLADLRVRQAIDMAIDRKAIAERLMAGQAVPATQIMLPGQYGYDPSLSPTKFDPAAAKAKLAAAGYPSGFHMAVHCQLRFYNADGFCQAVAQMLTRVGIHAEPVTMPHSMYVTHSIQHEYSFGTAFSLVDMGDPSTPLIGNSATYGGANGWGSSNRGRYSNPALDSLLARAQAQIDPTVREELLRHDAHRDPRRGIHPGVPADEHRGDAVGVCAPAGDRGVCVRRRGAPERGGACGAVGTRHLC